MRDRKKVPAQRNGQRIAAVHAREKEDGHLSPSPKKFAQVCVFDHTPSFPPPPTMPLDAPRPIAIAKGTKLGGAGAEKARQQAITAAADNERQTKLKQAVRLARADVKDNDPLSPDCYGLGLGQSGVTVIPFADAAELEGLRAMLEQSFNSFPEFNSVGFHGPSTFDNDLFVPVEGAFAGLATPSSFHNPCVRKIRMAAHVSVLRSRVVPVPNDCDFEQIADRLMIRRSKKTPGGETWHRDEATFAQPGDTIYGGWVNLDRHAPQRFSMCPGTANAAGVVDQNNGFAPIPDTDAPTYIRQSFMVEIPPGHIVIFNERTVHEVLAIASPPGVTKSRLFMGWRTTRSPHPITPNLMRRLYDQEALPLKSGQHAHEDPPPGAEALMRAIVGPARYNVKLKQFKYPGPPPMWSPMHKTSRTNANLLKQLGTHFKPAVLIPGGYRFANPDGELGRAFPAPAYLQTVPRFLPSLRELNGRDPSITMFPPYSTTELSILWPESEWTNLLDMQDKRLNIKLVASPSGYKTVQVEESGDTSSGGRVL